MERMGELERGTERASVMSIDFAVLMPVSEDQGSE